MYEGLYNVAYEACQTENFEKKGGFVYLIEM